MADNVAITAGSGTTIKTDDAGGAHYQIVKLADGTADATTVIAAGGGGEANALRVTLANDSTGVVSVDDNGATLSVDDGAGSLTVDNSTLSVTGTGTEATALRVTIATDSTGVLSVDDNGGSLTVDNADITTIAGAVSGGQMQVDVVAALPAGTNAIGKLAPNSGVDIGDVDVLSVIPGTGATNLGKAIDTAVGATDTGVAPLAVRDDALSSLTPIEGDYVPLRTDANGALWVKNSGTVTVDASGTAVPVTDNGATLSVDDGAGSLTIDNAALSVTGSGTESGALRVTIASDSTGVLSIDDNGGNISIDDGGNSITVDGTVTASNAAGDVAHDGADSGNPVKVGAQARQTNPTAVADADRVNLIADDVGRQVVVLNNVRDLVTTGSATLTTTANTSIIAAGGAGVLHDVTLVTLSNTSSTAVRVDFKDGTTTKFSVYLAADGGGAVVPFAVPLPGTANTAWNAALSAAVTDVRVFAQAVKNV